MGTHDAREPYRLACIRRMLRRYRRADVRWTYLLGEFENDYTIYPQNAAR